MLSAYEARGEAARYYILASHYRSPMNWTDKGLMQASASLGRLYMALRQLGDIDDERVNVPEAVLDAICDDLNTPQALAALHDMASAANKAETTEDKARLKNDLLAGGALLGILQQDPNDWLTMVGKSLDIKWNIETIEKKIAARKKARTDKDFTRADGIRDELKEAGIILEDGAGGTTWRWKH